MNSGPARKVGSVRWEREQRRRRRSKPPAATVAAPLEAISPPADLPPDQLAVWTQLAPHALLARTLTAGTAESFRDLCRAIVVRNGLFAKVQEDGWTYITIKTDPDGNTHEEIKRHPLVPDLRGWEQRVEAARARFRLAPMGKELPAVEAPRDGWEEFDEGPHLVKRA